MTFIKTAEIRFPTGVLRIETLRIEVTSNLPRPDPHWRYTDAQGHQHTRTDSTYPTLQLVNEPTHWCEDCEDEHTFQHYECAICKETIRPGSISPSMSPEYIAGPTSYYLDGEPIDSDRAQEFLREAGVQ